MHVSAIHTQNDTQLSVRYENESNRRQVEKSVTIIFTYFLLQAQLVKNVVGHVTYSE